MAPKPVFLARLPRERQSRSVAALPKVKQLQFDDLLTLEHTKCKPLAVEAPSRRILGFAASQIPASGTLATVPRELVRCTTRKKEHLKKHLWVYMDLHNRVLLGLAGNVGSWRSGLWDHARYART